MRSTLLSCLLACVLGPFFAHATGGSLLTPDVETEASTPRTKCKNCSQSRDLHRNVEDVRQTTSSRCNLTAVAANAKRIGAGTASHGMCLPSVRRAFQLAGCDVPAGFAMNAMSAFAALKRVWRCQSGGTAAGAPDKSVVFSVGCGSHHTEFKTGDCYYSDFHNPDCLASSEYAGCKYRQIGWCQP